MRSRFVPTLLAAALATLALAPSRASAQQGGKPQLSPPVVQKFVQAPYPPEAMAQKLEGTVILQIDVDAEGKVTQVTVLNPAGHGFDEAAIEAAKQFTFSPAQRDGKPVPSRIPYRYSFTLKAAEPEAPGDSSAKAPPAPRSLLRGQVMIGGSKESLGGAKVTVQGVAPGSAPVEMQTAPDGSWSFADLPPGKYKVKVEQVGYETLEVEEEVTLGQATEVVYRLRVPSSGYEVVIKGEKPPREVTKRTIEQRELARIPGTNGDALRAIQNMPGVARPPGLAGLLIVRGSAPQDTQVFVNGTLVPLVYHFGGLTSVIPTEMIDRLDFYPGNFSSQFGRVMGGIVDVGIRSPKSDGKYHGLAQADFIDARVMAEGPVPFLKGVTFIAGARRSYVDTWLKPALTAAGAGVTTAPVYYDYQAFVEARVGSKGTLRVGVYGADDRLEILIKNPAAQDPTFGGDLSFGTAFWRLQAEYKHEFSDKLTGKTMLSWGKNAIQFNLGSLYFLLDSYQFANRLELSYRMAPGVTVNVGQDILQVPYDLNLRAPPPPRPGEPSPGPFVSRPARVLNDSGAFYRPAAYAEAEIVPNERARIVPGIRADYTKEIEAWDVSPRVNGRYTVHNQFPKTSLKGGVGIFHQPPQPQEFARVFGTPNIKTNRAVHYSMGVEQQLTKQVDVSVEGFYKQLDNLVARTPNQVGGFDYQNTGEGYVVGAETLLRYRPDARFFGWVAYTLSRSVRRDRPNLDYNLFQYDQTHILTALGSYRLGGGWEFGARFRLVSGSLVTPCNGGIYNSASGSYACLSGPSFSERLPAFHQLDLRLDKRWDFDSWRLSFYVDVLNVYNHGNAEAKSYNYNFTQSIYQTGLPIIPSLGVRGEF